MKWNMLFGALVVSVGLCSQSFGFELLDRLLGASSGGCGGCNSCCEASCCDAEPSCCAAEPTCCAAAPTCCAAEPTCCEASACDSCNSCNTGCCKKKHCGLFGGCHGLFGGCHSCKKSCCAPACEPTCCAAPACEPACCAAEPTCCEAPACNSCNSGCCKKKHCGLFSGLFHCKKSCCNSCSSCNSCNSCCGDNNGCAGGCNSCGGGAAADSGSDVPPAPPVADQSASVQGKRRIVQTSSVARRN